jgi:hypothetical protein
MEILACTLAVFAASVFVLEAFIGLIELIARDMRKARMRALADEIMRERFGNQVKENHHE